MFIGICGSICAGKSTVAQYLVEHHGFRHLYIEPAALETNGAVKSFSSNQGDEPAVFASHDKKPNGVQVPSRPTPSAPVTGSSRTYPLSVRPPRQSLTFPSAEALLDFVTQRWNDRWVTADVADEHVLEIFSRRPFFLLISVDAPMVVRWRRFQQRQQSQLHAPGIPNGTGTADESGLVTLETFVQQSDTHLYDPAAGQLPLMSRAMVRLLNTSSDLAHLYATLGKVDLLNADRLRPSWDTYFMALASLAARRSNCMKRRVGCVLVRERRVISTGYNGTPRGLRNCGEGGCGRCNEGQGAGVGLATCLCIHAEENALLEAGRERIREGAILYCDTCPCLTCSIKIAQVGISEVVYSQGYSMDGETAAVFREAGVRLRQFVPPANGLIHLEKMELY